MVRGALLGRRARIAERKALRIEADAKSQAKAILDESKTEADKIKIAAENEYRQRRGEIQRQENRLTQKIDSLDRKLENLEGRDRNLNNREKEIDNLRASVNEIKQQQLKKLEEISQLTSADAKNILLEKMEAEMKEETARRIREWEFNLQQQANGKDPGDTLSGYSALGFRNRFRNHCIGSPDTNDGNEGPTHRSGRSQHQSTRAGYRSRFDHDDTPRPSHSQFRPVRREIARLALTRLILNGRIHPARIEEVVNKAKEEVEATIYSAGEQAAIQTGVQGLRPELIRILGRLKYRTSYGQNVLNHSIETAFLAGMIAGEIGANITLAKKAGLLHDIGKPSTAKWRGAMPLSERNWFPDGTNRPR
jgi:ribonuclease Y